MKQRGEMTDEKRLAILNEYLSSDDSANKVLLYRLF